MDTRQAIQFLRETCTRLWEDEQIDLSPVGNLNSPLAKSIKKPCRWAPNKATADELNKAIGALSKQEPEVRVYIDDWNREHSAHLAQKIGVSNGIVIAAALFLKWPYTFRHRKWQGRIFPITVMATHGYSFCAIPMDQDPEGQVSLLHVNAFFK